MTISMRPKKTLRLFFTFLFSISHLHAQDFHVHYPMGINDSIKSTLPYQGSKDAWNKQFTYIGAPLFVAGLAIWQKQDEYRSMRNGFIPKYSTFLDDYSQYSPLAITAILKACGVKTRSSWSRFTVSSAFSAAIMATLVNSIKYSVREMRPDNSTRNSFPSGHTSTSFMCASIMHKELGDRSPWYSIGAYTIATATGLSRVFNNRHWINDVVFGAGVGITATDLGYFLGDVIFQNKGINKQNSHSNIPNISGNPSFLSIGMSVGRGTDLKCPEIFEDYNELVSGEELTPKEGAKSMNLGLKMGTTTSLNIEGAYFFNRYFGIGGRARAMACPITVSYSDAFKPFIIISNDESREQLYKLVGIESASLGIIELDFGPYLSFPLGSRWRIGCRVLVGNRYTTPFELNSFTTLSNNMMSIVKEFYIGGMLTKEEYESFLLPTYDKSFMKIDGSSTINIDTGLSLTYAYKENMSVRMHINYNYSAPKYRYHFFNRIYEGENQDYSFIEDTFKRRTIMNDFSFGISLAAMF